MAGRTKKKGNKICSAGIAWAKRTFDKYPSAYANMAASKYCKDRNYAKNSKRGKIINNPSVTVAIPLIMTVIAMDQMIRANNLYE